MIFMILEAEEKKEKEKRSLVNVRMEDDKKMFYLVNRCFIVWFFKKTTINISFCFAFFLFSCLGVEKKGVFSF